MTPVEALTQIRALCDGREHGPGPGWIPVDEVRTVLDAVSVDATSAQGDVRAALAKLLDAFIPDEALDYERLDALTTAVFALVRPVEGILLTPEEAALAAEAVRTSVEWDRPPRELAHRRALAARLETSS